MGRVHRQLGVSRQGDIVEELQTGGPQPIPEWDLDLISTLVMGERENEKVSAGR